MSTFGNAALRPVLVCDYFVEVCKYFRQRRCYRNQATSLIISTSLCPPLPQQLSNFVFGKCSKSPQAVEAALFLREAVTRDLSEYRVSSAGACSGDRRVVKSHLEHLPHMPFQPEHEVRCAYLDTRPPSVRFCACVKKRVSQGFSYVAPRVPRVFAVLHRRQVAVQLAVAFAVTLSSFALCSLSEWRAMNEWCGTCCPVMNSFSDA